MGFTAEGNERDGAMVLVTTETRANHFHLPPAKSPPPAYCHLDIYKSYALAVTQPAVSKHLRCFKFFFYLVLQISLWV